MAGTNDREAQLAAAYPGLKFRRHSLGWLARFMRAPAECIHLETQHDWMASFAPDMIYLRGKARTTNGAQARPEVSLCRECLLGLLEPELTAYRGRVVGFEPNAQEATQYFFVSADDFDAAGLRPEVASAIDERLRQVPKETCTADGCSRRAAWLWFSRREVASLDETSLIHRAPGRFLCARHGAAALSDALRAIAEMNLLYVNVPYGDAGAYIWV
jgi:hypothetical protein